MRVRDDLVAVVGFYSRLPVGPPRPGVSLAEAAWTVPLASLVIAAPAAALTCASATLGLSPLAAAGFGVAALIATSGALHEDGLADCADGFWGGATVERRLEIMRDPRVGTFGALALVLAVLLRVALLAQALAAGTVAGIALLVAAAVAGRTAGLYPWVGLPPARTEGLAVAAGRPRPAVFRRAVLIALAAIFVLSLAAGSLAGGIAGAIAAALGARAVAALADSKLGGHTGDVVGAAVVAAEVAFLTAATPFL